MLIADTYSTEISPKNVRSFSDLAQLYYVLLMPPTAELAQAMANGNFFDDMEMVLREVGFSFKQDEPVWSELRQQCFTTGSEALLHELRRDYTRLFLRTSKEPRVPLYESLLLWDSESGKPKPLLITNKQAHELSRYYKKVSLKRQVDMNDSEDHFAFQCLFLSKLLLLMSVNKENWEEGVRTLASYKKEHLNLWVVPFFTLCEKESASDVYRFMWKIAIRVAR